ncbi:MAG: nucleotide exchange factor GrpE [Candidatus Wildermuthbacteria bacterium]|nr:nucleotide exchange factor GrpE [Candidatus Wildermuthbacteria bacterium]
MEKEQEELKKQLEETLRQKDEYLAQWKLARADLINYKKEDLGRMKLMREYAAENLILKLLPILDNLEIAEQKIPNGMKEDEYIKGVLSLKAQFQGFLKNQNVEELEAQGKAFDPAVHEAVQEEEIADKEPGKVLEVLEKGYLYQGRLLRPAKVKVSK